MAGPASGGLAWFLGFNLLPFLFSLWLFRRWIFVDIEVRWGLGFAAQLSFAATVSLLFAMHASLLGEAFAHSDEEVREGGSSGYYGMDEWSLYFLGCVLILKVWMPHLLFLAGLRALTRGRFLPETASLAAGLQACWLFLALYLPWRSDWSFKENVKREAESVGGIGIVIVAILSGWGAVYGPYTYGSWFVPEYAEAEIARVESRILHINETIAGQKRRACVAKAVRDLGNPHSSERSGSRRERSGADDVAGGVAAWARRRLGLPEASGRPAADEVGAGVTKSLELLSRELMLELTEMKSAKRSVLFRRTLLGRLHSGMGYVFALYCVLRVAAACQGLIWPRALNEPDLVQRLIRGVVSRLASSRTQAAWTQGVSFVFIGTLVFNSFRGLLWNAGRAFQHCYGRADAASGVLVSLILTEVVGLYLLSSCVVLNLSLPLEFRRASSEFDRFDYFRLRFDGIFFLSALSSGALLWGLDRDKRSRTEFYHEETGAPRREEEEEDLESGGIKSR